MYENELITKTPYTQKPGVTNVLSEIYSMGNSKMGEEEFNKFKSDKNIEIHINAVQGGIYSDFSGSNKNYKQGIELVNDLLLKPRLTEENLQKAKSKIRDSIERSEDTANSVYADFDAKTNPFFVSKEDIIKNLDSITLKDVEDCHKYLVENSYGNVKVNIPQNFPEVKNFVLAQTGSMLSIKQKSFDILNLYSKTEKPILLTKVKNNSQADIKQVYRYKFEDSLKNIVIDNLMNSILTGSSIGLFDVLREKEHLAYSVYSNNNHMEDRGEISLNILTTTDNKNIGEISFDNVQKSLNGFKRQIEELKNGNFILQDLESAKKIMKAELLDKEGVRSKLDSLKMNSKHGVIAENDIYKIIDSITKEDIIEYAKKVFAEPPVTVVVASQDTLDANKEYLKQFSL